jgi:PAS domain S-box-containing protein
LKAHDHYIALVESSDDAIAAKDLDSTIVSWNPAAERLFGYTAAEMVGQSIRKLIPAERQEEEDRILANIGAGKRVGQFLTQRLHKDGRVIDIFVTVSPVVDGEGRIVGASKIARDASEFVTTRRELEARELRFRLLADNISQFAWVCQPDGKFIWFNQRFEEFTGKTLEDMDLGARYMVVHPEHVDRVYAKFRLALDSGEDWEDVFPMRSKEGEYRWFLSRALPIRDGEGHILQWFGTNTDITDQREEAEQADLLLREASHRSKNLLATVQALARRTARGNTEFFEHFEERMRGLANVQDLLYRGDWREVPVAELVRRQLAFLGDLRDKLELSGPDCSLIPPAAEAIGMAIHELATNSLKYGALSSADGTVSVEWTCDKARGSFAIDWRDKGGPQVQPPTRDGFGTTLIRDLPRAKLDANVTLEFPPDGVVWTLEGENLLAGDAAQPN